MQDRLNFRFWDTKKRVMLDWDCICQTAFNCTHEKGNKALRYGLMYWAFTTPSRFIPLQCTGLKDKNDKLVYFDDLVRLPDGVIGKVAQIRDIDNNDYGRVVILPVANILNKVYQRFYVPTMIKYSEIIGNIYENPKLLEEKQC